MSMATFGITREESMIVQEALTLILCQKGAVLQFYPYVAETTAPTDTANVSIALSYIQVGIYYLPEGISQNRVAH